MPSRRKRKREREAGLSPENRPRGDREGPSLGERGLRAQWTADVESIALVRKAVDQCWQTPMENRRAILNAVIDAGLNGTPSQSIRTCWLMLAIDRSNFNLACERLKRR
jgi:hypothetical protein